MGRTTDELTVRGRMGWKVAGMTRRRMLLGSGAALAVVGLAGTTGLGRSQDVYAHEREHSTSATPRSKPSIVLVHGAFADGTGWQHVIRLLEREGYPVIAVQNTLTSLADDIATTKRVIDAESQKGPVIVVAHSYGGAVITGAAFGNLNVKALVYIAAFAPEAGEPVAAFLERYPSLLGTALVPDAAGFLTVDRSKFREVFARDVDRSAARVMAATQKPIFGQIFGQATDAVAWKNIPSWYLVTTEDQAINPELERFYANRMGATIVEVEASHAVFVSRPEKVVQLIEQAAQ